MNMPLIKICGITREHDLKFCQDMGIDLTGFIFHPFSPRCVDPVVVGQWEKKTELRVGVFVKKDAHEIMEIIEQVRLDLVQLHGGQDLEFCRRIGSEKVMRVFWPERYENRHELENEMQVFADACKYFLLDAGKNMGGHGRGIACSWLKELQAPKPYFLAGGLGSDNIQNVLDLGMTGLDLNSGVEISPGVKDHDKIINVMGMLANG